MGKDIIYREDAIEALKGREDILHDAYTAVAIIRSIPSADRPQEWIPCKERLPKEYEVLCCDIYKNCIVGHPFADDSASTGFSAESEGEFMYECVAWMSLPKPWKGADDDSGSID